MANHHFGSPHCLKLRLFCAAKIPVKKLLDVWPASPISIRQSNPPTWGKFAIEKRFCGDAIPVADRSGASESPKLRNGTGHSRFVLGIFSVESYPREPQWPCLSSIDTHLTRQDGWLLACLRLRRLHFSLQTSRSPPDRPDYEPSSAFADALYPP